MKEHEARLRQECTARGLRYVGTRGNPKAPVWVVGEAPGADEDQQGYPFVGASGQLLDRMLSEAGFASGDLCFTNPFKVRPPDNKLERIHELGIPDEIFLSQFYEELAEAQPRIVIVCGATPLSVLCPHTWAFNERRSEITKWRGSLLSSSRVPGAYVVPVLHPAAVMREWGERQIAVLCLGKAKEEWDYIRKNGTLRPLPERELITEPSPQAVLEFLDFAVASPFPVSNDIETIGGKYPYTISVATSPKRAISFSLWNYDLDLLVRIWIKLDNLLRFHPTIGQNWTSFDIPNLYRLGFSPNVDIASDTMVRHHTLWPEFEHKLQFQTFQYTREPYYKDEGKLWSPKEGMHRLQLYNCKDTTVTYEIHEMQENDFNDRPHTRTFFNEVAMPRARAYARMDARGILVHRDRLAKLRDEVLRSISNYVAEAEQQTGRAVASASCLNPSHKSQCKCNIKAVALAKGCKQKEVFNIGSPKQVQDVLEGRGIKIPLKRATKYKPSRKSVDETALRRIVLDNQNEKLPLTILNIRELNKMKGTYIDTRLSEDGVLYSTLKPCGTITFRSGSQTNPFGLGTNNQNFPKHSELGKKFRDCLIARQGKILLAGDQKGAEDWIVQGTIVDNGGSRRGLDELLSGINRHKRLASFLFGKPEDQIDKEGMEYYLGKRTRHAGNYDMRENTMADNLLKEGYPVPVNYCAWLLNKFHEVEPDIRGVYHKVIQELLRTTRTLTNPLGFERIFFGLRPYSDNAEVFREGYAQIPQSTVACNNGMAIIVMDKAGACILKDDHDATTLEVDDNKEAITNGMRLFEKAYDRIIRFPHGLELKIPLELELGYSLGTMKSVKANTEEELMKAWSLCQESSVARVG